MSSQPKIAFFRWCALQAIRPARLVEWFEEKIDICGS
jgi:hypothetical protein